MMFTPHQADAVRRALRKGLDQEGPPTLGLDARLGAALADKGRVRFTADQKDDVRSALRDEKNLRVDLGAALAENNFLTDLDLSPRALHRCQPTSRNFVGIAGNRR